MASVNEILTDILADGVLDNDEYMRLRKQIFSDGHISITEADMIFKIDTELKEKPEGWNEFFVNAITDFLIRQTLPVGFVDPIHATWLMERIDQDDRMDEATEEALLLSVLKFAENCPENLEVYTLNKIRQKIVGRAVTSDLSVQENDVSMIERVLYACNALQVGSQEVALIKKVVYASGGHGGFGVSKAEAAFLFELDEATKGQENCESWQKLFVGAIANHLMTMGAPQTIDREEYKRAQEFLHSTGGIKWGGLTSGESGSFWDLVRSKRDQSQFTDYERIVRAEQIDINEAQWLINHLNRDGEISENELALLRFIKTECPDIHESLEPLLLRYAA